MNLNRFVKSFINAFAGLKHVFKSEQNFRIQVVAGLLTIAASVFFSLKISVLIIC